MKNFLVAALVLLGIGISNAQINKADSTVQVIAYYGLKETATYKVEFAKKQIKDNDTIIKNAVSYFLDVEVIDSTASSYTIEFNYRDFAFNSDEEVSVISKLLMQSQSPKVVVKTDEYGTFEEVVNWKEVRDFTKTTIDDLLKKYPDLNTKEFKKQFEHLYNSKEAVSANTKDIQHLLYFHGTAHELDDATVGEVEMPNPYQPEKPFIAQLTVYLDEIDFEDDTYIMRSFTEVDSEQLTATLNTYLDNLRKSIGKKAKAAPVVNPEDLKIELEYAAVIDDWGWVLYTFETKTVSFADGYYIEERTIEIQ